MPTGVGYTGTMKTTPKEFYRKKYQSLDEALDLIVQGRDKLLILYSNEVQAPGGSTDELNVILDGLAAVEIQIKGLLDAVEPLAE